jgi:hypothetical protein
VENSALLCGVAVAVAAVVSLEVWMRKRRSLGEETRQWPNND